MLKLIICASILYIAFAVSLGVATGIALLWGFLFFSTQIVLAMRRDVSHIGEQAKEPQREAA